MTNILQFVKGSKFPIRSWGHVGFRMALLVKQLVWAKMSHFAYAKFYQLSWSFVLADLEVLWSYGLGLTFAFTATFTMHFPRISHAFHACSCILHAFPTHPSCILHAFHACHAFSMHAFHAFTMHFSRMLHMHFLTFHACSYTFIWPHMTQEISWKSETFSWFFLGLFFANKMMVFHLFSNEVLVMSGQAISVVDFKCPIGLAVTPLLFCEQVQPYMSDFPPCSVWFASRAAAGEKFCGVLCDKWFVSLRFCRKSPMWRWSMWMPLLKSHVFGRPADYTVSLFRFCKFLHLWRWDFLSYKLTRRTCFWSLRAPSKTLSWILRLVLVAFSSALLFL